MFKHLRDFFLFSSPRKGSSSESRSPRVIALPEYHTSMNSVFEWHPSSDLLASIRFDSKAHIWNLNEKQLHRFAQTDPSSIKSPPKIDLHGAVVLGDKAMKSLAWHPQGIVLATVSEDGVVHIWTTQGKCIKTVDTDISPTSVLKWNEKWSHLLIGGQHKKIGSVTVLDVGAQYSKERFQCDYEQPVSDVAWLNRNTFATCSVYEPLVHIFQLGVTAPIRIFQGHTGAVHEMIWHADSELLACRSNNELIKVWMLSNGASQGRLVDSIYGFSEIRKIQWSPTGPGTVNDGKRPKLALVFDIMISIWDVDQRKCLRRFIKHEKDVHTFAYSPDGRYLASVSSDRWLYIWSPLTGKVRYLHKFTGFPFRVRWSSRGDKIAIATDAGPIELLDFREA